MSGNGVFTGVAGCFLAQSRASIENPSVSLQDPDAWNELFGGGTMSASGEAVSPAKSLGIAAVWQCVSMISADVAGLPLDCYVRTDDGREVDKSHPAQKVVRRQWNETTTAYRGWRTLLVNALLWGNGFAYIDRDGSGNVRGLYNLLPDRTIIERKHGKTYVVTEVEHKLQAIGIDSILHVAGMSNDGLAGEAIVKSARDAWGLSLSAQGFASKFFKAGGRMGGTLEIPLGTSVQYQNKVEGGFRAKYEQPGEWFKTVILRDGAKFHQGSWSPNESQLNETRENQVREVARYYNVPVSRLGLAGSVSYNSKSEDNQNYLDATLKPWMREIADTCWMRLLKTSEKDGDSHYFEHNPGSLLTMDPLRQSQSFAIGIRNRYLLPNEARRKLNMPPIPGGDEFPEVKPTPAGGADKGENDRPRGPAGNDNVNEESDPDNLSRMRLTFKICDHARKKGKNHRSFGEFLKSGRDSYSEAEFSDVVERCFDAFSTLEAIKLSELPERLEETCQTLERSCQ